MQCPVDGERLVMSERQGVEIDYCPQCRGVWLDRGELDKILDRSVTESAPRGAERAGAPQQQAYQDPRGQQQYGQRKKKESWLGDLLDFG
ncbi:zf-TFIIB domain-containing protein [Demequina sp.]|uniref:TFIIB-type zinc ribbon-containing protein n=1 Tax=Demequina sp. TaxID=2050685 RepID=UPI003D0F433F